MEKADLVGFIIIPPTVVADVRLTAGQKMVYGRVFGFIERHGYCDAPNEYLARHIGMGKEAFKKNLKKLYELGYLRYEVLRGDSGEVQQRKIYPALGVGEYSTRPRVPGGPTGRGAESPNINKNGERKNNVDRKRRSQEEIAYYAELLADKLSDHKSITFYKIACQSYDPQRLLQKAAEIVADGGARNPAAVFTHWLRADKESG